MRIATLVKTPEKYVLDLDDYIPLDPHTYERDDFQLCFECDGKGCTSCLEIIKKLKDNSYAALLLIGGPAHYFVRSPLNLISNEQIRHEKLQGYEDVFSAHIDERTLSSLSSSSVAVTAAIKPMCYTNKHNNKVLCWHLPHVRHPDVTTDEWSDIWNEIEICLKTIVTEKSRSSF